MRLNQHINQDHEGVAPISPLPRVKREIDGIPKLSTYNPKNYAA